MQRLVALLDVHGQKTMAGHQMRLKAVELQNMQSRMDREYSNIRPDMRDQFPTYKIAFGELTSLRREVQHLEAEEKKAASKCDQVAADYQAARDAANDTAAVIARVQQDLDQVRRHNEELTRANQQSKEDLQRLLKDAEDLRQSITESESNRVSETKKWIDGRIQKQDVKVEDFVKTSEARLETARQEDRELFTLTLTTTLEQATSKVFEAMDSVKSIVSAEQIQSAEHKAKIRRLEDAQVATTGPTTANLEARLSALQQELNDFKQQQPARKLVENDSAQSRKGFEDLPRPMPPNIEERISQLKVEVENQLSPLRRRVSQHTGEISKQALDISRHTREISEHGRDILRHTADIESLETDFESTSSLALQAHQTLQQVREHVDVLHQQQQAPVINESRIDSLEGSFQDLSDRFTKWSRDDIGATSIEDFKGCTVWNILDACQDSVRAQMEDQHAQMEELKSKVNSLNSLHARPNNNAASILRSEDQQANIPAINALRAQFDSQQTLLETLASAPRPPAATPDILRITTLEETVQQLKARMQDPRPAASSTAEFNDLQAKIVALERGVETQSRAIRFLDDRYNFTSSREVVDAIVRRMATMYGTGTAPALQQMQHEIGALRQLLEGLKQEKQVLQESINLVTSRVHKIELTASPSAAATTDTEHATKAELELCKGEYDALQKATKAELELCKGEFKALQETHESSTERLAERITELQANHLRDHGTTSRKVTDLEERLKRKADIAMVGDVQKALDETKEAARIASETIGKNFEDIKLLQANDSNSLQQVRSEVNEIDAKIKILPDLAPAEDLKRLEGRVDHLGVDSLKMGVDNSTKRIDVLEADVGVLKKEKACASSAGLQPLAERIEQNAVSQRKRKLEQLSRSPTSSMGEAGDRGGGGGSTVARAPSPKRGRPRKPSTHIPLHPLSKKRARALPGLRAKESINIEDD